MLSALRNLTAKVLTPILAVTLIGLIGGAQLITKNVEESTDQQVKIALKALKNEQKSAQQGLLDALQSKAETIGRFMAKTAPELIFSYDFGSLKAYQEEAATDKDVAYAAYLDPEGKTFIAFEAPEDMSQIIERRYPIEFEGEEIGFVLLGMSKATMNEGIIASETRIGEAVREVNTTGDEALAEFYKIITVVVLSIVGLISIGTFFLFRIFVIRPLRETSNLIGELSSGHGDLTTRLPVIFKDEIGQMRVSVNRFISELQTMVRGIVSEVQKLNEQAEELRRGNLTSMPVALLST